MAMKAILSVRAYASTISKIQALPVSFGGTTNPYTDACAIAVENKRIGTGSIHRDAIHKHI